MVETNVPLPLLPAHIEETIRSIARLHAEHHQNATPLQRAVDRITALLGSPPIPRRADRHRGRLDQPEFARRRAWLSPYRSASLPRARTRGLAGVALHSRLDPGHPAA
jgi:hypothetical protein